MKNGIRAVLVGLIVLGVTLFLTVRLGQWIGDTVSVTAPVQLNESILSEENDYVADVRAAAETIRQRWSYLEMRRELSGVDVDRLESEALAMLGEEPDSATFQHALTYLVAGLKDGHGGVIAADYNVPEAYRWPFTLVEVREGIMLDGIDNSLVRISGETGASTRLQRGDLLLEVDGRPIDECITAAEAFICASTDSARRLDAITRMARFDGNPTRTFLLRRSDGSELTCVLDLPASYESVAQGHELETTPSHRMLENSVGYYRPGTFSPPEDSGWPGPPEKRNEILRESYATIDAVFDDLAGARALILDLRDNPGGTDLLGEFLIDRLVEPGYVYFQLSSPGRRGWKGYHDQSPGAPKGNNTLRTPLVCLIDERTFSTADNVAACLADVHPDVTFVGRPNGAGSGAPRDFELPRTGTRILFCTMRVRTPKGRSAEGFSVPLDSPVRWTREDILAGRDADLEKALGLLRE